MDKNNLAWEYPQPEKHNPYQAEWEHLITAVREDQTYNEVQRGAMASIVTSMGRMAAHTGQEITYDQMLHSKHQFGPGVEKLSLESDSPLLANAEGLYPVPAPGINKSQEY